MCNDLTMGDNNGDHYSILGLDQTCSTDELRQAYKKLALQYHPDRPKTGDEEKFRAIERAYKVLSDPESRTDYDIHLDNSARLDHPVWQVVALDELILQDELHTMECRCGGTMRLDSQLASGQLPIIIQCEDCSTYVRVNPAE
ncbi:chaperone protein DnaJ-like [Tropilaelaps mercedesae]|uniref:Chaperone protein DnaJ-like n=1 Tax=Tropilaelaps mercedesae TaxID=418985 RepID=A0A1V9XQJ0_9ACAR|nr:chaperone protein DnaJ-like [Tropilaelaps mercedesae]